MALMFAFLNLWYYFTSAYYVKLLYFFIALYNGRLSSLSFIRAVWYKVKHEESSRQLFTGALIRAFLSRFSVVFSYSICVRNAKWIKWIKSSLVKGQVSERQGDSTRVLNTQGSLVKGRLESAHYLDNSSFLYLHESGTRVSLVRFMLVSKLSYYLDFSSLFYLCGSGTSLLQGVVLFQASIRFSTFTSLAQEYFLRRCIIAVFLVSLLGSLLVRLHHVLTTCNMASSASPL